MKRREILQPRHYAAVPKATLARTGLTASAKVVYATLLGHLFSDEADTAHPSTAKIAQEAGMGRRTVIRALAGLQATGLIATNHHPGRPTEYTFPNADTPEALAQLESPSTDAKMAPPQGEKPTITDADMAYLLATAAENGPEPEWHDPQANMAHPPDRLPVPDLHHTGANMPPTGANLAGASMEEERLKERFEEQQQPPFPPNQKERDSAAAVLDRLRAAYREATGRTMPARWAEAIRNEHRNGDREILGEIDAETIRAGIRFAEKRRIAFAFQTLILSIHQVPRPEVAAATAAREQAHCAEAINDMLAEIEADHAAAQAADRKAALEYFETIDAKARAAYRNKAAALPGIDLAGPDAVEILAALRAYHDRPPEPRNTEQGATA